MREGLCGEAGHDHRQSLFDVLGSIGVLVVALGQALIIFGTVGLAFARDFLLNLGIEASYTTIAALGMALTTLLAFRGILSVIAVLILTALVTIPQSELSAVSLDHDALRALAIVIMLYPWIKKVATDN